MSLLYNDPEHWRQRAEGLRALARMMSDRAGREALIDIAQKYDRLAARAITRLSQTVEEKRSP